MFGTYQALLALMVVGQHIGGLPRIGSYAVFGFYALSGYLMTFIMQNNYGYSRFGIGKYALNRFLRIYPIYWVSIAVSALLVMLIANAMGLHLSRPSLSLLGIAIPFILAAAWLLSASIEGPVERIRSLVKSGLPSRRPAM